MLAWRHKMETTKNEVVKVEPKTSVAESTFGVKLPDKLDRQLNATARLCQNKGVKIGSPLFLKAVYKSDAVLKEYGIRHLLGE